MIWELLALGGAIVGATFYKTNKSMQLDDEAQRKYAKAFAREEEARALVRNKEKYTDLRLSNVAKKKNAIIRQSFPRFEEVYGKIQRIYRNNSLSAEVLYNSNLDHIEKIKTISLISKKEFTKKELICGLLTRGIANTMVKESRRNLSSANSQLSASNVVYSQAESIAEIYDAIIKRADWTAQKLTEMNILFLNSIKESERVIEKNGTDVRNYSKYDIGVLRNMVNIAEAVADLINVPVIDTNGQLVEASVEILEKAGQFITEMNNLINSY